jgi:hypothetical protein
MFIFLFFEKRTIDRLKMVQYLSVLKKYMQLQVPLPVKFSEKQTIGINYQEQRGQ